MLDASMSPREVLERLIQDRREDYSSVSKLLGRNVAYIQQFIRRGTPRKLNEDDRRTLARYFGVSEVLLGAPGSGADKTFVEIPVLDLAVSAGPGATPGLDLRLRSMAFDERYVRELTGGQKGELSIVRVKGDSMVPTLNDGDDIAVDRNDAGSRLRDGIYVLRMDEQVIVKRVAVGPKGKVTVKSDNSVYGEWTATLGEGLEVIGRVVWYGRKMR